MPALVTFLDVTAQRSGPAGRDVAQGAALLGREHIAMEVEEGVTMVPEDISHFKLRPRHGCDPPFPEGTSRSSGL
jgi:hypothetical protein